MNPDVLRELSLLRELGYTHLDLTAPAVPAALAATIDQVDQRPAAEAEARIAAAAVTGGSPASCLTLDELRPFAMDCTACRLSGTRTQVVFGTGNPDADLMFVGEAPGRDEDLQGEPFVGRAGQLLTDIIKAMKLTREQVYIANVIKCRPPENRNPEPDELESCRPYIRKQVELIRPKVIVTLGRFSLQSLTGKSYAITAIRGSWLEYEGVKMMPTFHPAYLLRNPGAKKEVWSDMKKVMGELGLL
jgi:DNA polymerase